MIVLRRPSGNRREAKVCGVMPSRVHAQMLVAQLERAESVVRDLFLEATDDGIEALEAVLTACCTEVLEKGPAVPPPEREQAAREAAADVLDEPLDLPPDEDDDVDPYADA